MSPGSHDDQSSQMTECTRPQGVTQSSDYLTATALFSSSFPFYSFFTRFPFFLSFRESVETLFLQHLTRHATRRRLAARMVRRRGYRPVGLQTPWPMEEPWPPREVLTCLLNE